MFDSRRKTLLRRLQWLVVAPLGALILTGLILGAEWLAIESDAIGIDGSLIEAVQKGANAVLGAVGLNGYAVPRWLLITLIAYPFALVLWSRKLAEALRDRFFPVYDDSRFRRITRTMPEIGAELALPWAKGSRLDALAVELVKTLRDPGQVGDDAVPWYQPWQRSKPPLAFDHFVVAGRPGAGKSRLIHRVARELGRRDVLGNAGRDKPGNEPAALALERGDSRRRRWWFKARWPQDPWDSGIVPQVLPESFAAWRPARPTLLWLDDPAAERAEEWINRLREFSSTYRFAVRLAVVGQSALDGLPAAHQLAALTLARHTYFTVPDLIGLTRAVGLHHVSEVTCERIHQLTEGNPLLVELALDFLRRGKPVSELSEDAIIAERIGRIRQALDNAHADFRLSAGKHAVALGTLAGPDCPISAVLGHFPGISLSRESLAAAFPSEAQRGLDLAQVMPSVRPVMIGDAFVRSIAADRADLAGLLAAATAATDTGLFVTAMERLGRTPGPLADALCDQALWRSDWPADMRLRYHQTLIGLALRGCRDGPETAAQVASQLDGLPAAERTAAEDALYAWIEGEAAALGDRIAASDQRWHADLAAGLTPIEARRAQDQEALEAPTLRFYAGRPLAIFWSMLASRSVGRATLKNWNQEFIEGRRSLVARYYALVSQLDCRLLTEDDTLRHWTSLFPASQKAIPRLQFGTFLEMSYAIPAGIEQNLNLGGAIRKALVSATWIDDSPISDMLKLQQLADSCNDPLKAMACARQVESLAVIISEDPESPFLPFVGMMTILSWYAAAWNDRSSFAQRSMVKEQLADSEKAILDGRVTGRAAELSLMALALSRCLVSEHKDVGSDERAALIGEVEQLVELMRDRGYSLHGVMNGFASALSNYAFDLIGDPIACRNLVERTVHIVDANGSRDTTPVCRSAAMSWRHLACASQRDILEFNRALREVEAIALRPRFANDLEIRVELAHVYAYAVVAHYQTLHLAEEYFRKMHAIASHFELAGPGYAQWERVQANMEIAMIFRHDPAKFAEFEGLLRDFVSKVKPSWHQYDDFQAAVKRLEQARPFGLNRLQ